MSLNKPYEPLFLVLAGLMGAFALGVAFLPPYPAYQDLTEWIYQGHIASDLIRGIAVPGFRIASYPIPNSASQLLLALFSMVVPPLWAGRLFISLYAAAAIAVATLLARKFHPALIGSFACVLLITIFFNSPFWNGYANSTTGLLLFAAFLLVPEQKARDFGVVLAFSLLIFFTHAIAFCAFVAVVSWRMLARWRLDIAAAALIPTLILSLWYLIKKPHAETPNSGLATGALHFFLYKIYSLAKIGPYHDFVFSSGGDAVTRPAVYWLGVTVNVLYMAGFVILIGLGLRQCWKKRTFKPELAAAACLAAFFPILPDVVADVGNPGERFLYPALLLLLLYLPLSASLVRALAAGSVMMLIAVFGALTWQGDWYTVVNDRIISATPAKVLFVHRPTSNAEKIAEINRAAAAHDRVRLPLTFTTSFLQPGP